jgi:hypothetical protein
LMRPDEVPTKRRDEERERVSAVIGCLNEKSDQHKENRFSARTRLILNVSLWPWVPVRQHG